MDKNRILQIIDEFHIKLKAAVLEGGGARYDDATVLIIIEKLCGAGMWNDKAQATFERMTGNGGLGRAFDTLTEGNAAIARFIQENFVDKEPEPDKPKRGRPPKDKTEKADA